MKKKSSLSGQFHHGELNWGVTNHLEMDFRLLAREGEEKILFFTVDGFVTPKYEARVREPGSSYHF